MKNSSEIIYQRLKIDGEADCSIASQIAQQIRWLIVVNELHAGEKLPSVRNLADHLKVNLHTVRSAYHQLEEAGFVVTKQGVGSIVIEYVPSETVGQKTIASNTFGIIVPDLRNPFYPQFISGAAKIATEHNVLMIICDTRESSDLGRAFFDMLITKHVDGVIVSPTGKYPETNDFFDEHEFFDFPIPVVFADRPNIEGFSVLIDAHDAGYKATQHLVEHGHQNIAILTGNLTIPTLYEVYEGYQHALNASSIRVDPSLVIEVDGFSYEAGYDAVSILIETGNLPSAIFAAGDMLAIGAIKALQDKSLRVPKDVAIVGYNDIDVSNFVTPSLTSVQVPVEKMGEESTKLLLALMRKKKVSREPIVMPIELIARKSCGCK